MAVISRTPQTDRAINTATFFTRSAVAVGVPLYLYFNLDSVPTLNSPPSKLIAASVVVLSAPATLYCALGALEGVVRSCIQFFNYHAGTNPAYHWDQCSKEATTTFGLVQATISPLAGYTFMAREWNKLGSGQDKGHPRVLKEEYFVYSVPRSAGHQLVEAGKWVLGQLKIRLDKSIAQITTTIETGWKGVCWIADTTVSVANWAWRVSQPYRELAWNIVITVKNWSIDRLIDLWNISRPLRNVIKIIVWDQVVVKLIWTSLIKTVLWQLFLKTIVWKLALETIVWKFLVKTVIADWIITKLFWNLICETIIGKLIWPPIKFIGRKIIWPVVKWVINLLGNIIMIALNAIAWALQQAFRRGR